jgi:EpsI family protein
MVRAWASQETASHGFLIAPLAAYLAWQRRSRIAAAYRGGATAAGLVATAGAAAMCIAGRWLGMDSVAPLSLVLMIGAQLLYFGGWAVVREAAFPYFFLFFMVPWPDDLLVELMSFPMQLLSVKYATMLVGLLGIPVSRSGVDIHLAHYDFTVAVPCSGMQTLVAMMALAAVIAYLAQGAMWRRVALFIAGTPIALAANVTRIVAILLIATFAGAKAAEGFFHGFSGVFVFLVAVGGLLLVARAVGLRDVLRSAAGRSDQPRSDSAPPASGARPATRVRHALIMLGVLLAAQAGAWAVRSSSGPSRNGERPAVRAEQVPLRVGAWRGRDLGPFDDLTMDQLRPDAYVNREYRAADGSLAHLAVVFGHRRTSFHSPGFCLLGSGYNIVAKSRLTLRPRVGNPTAVNRFVLTRGGDEGVVLYYYVQGQRATASWVAHRLYLVEDRMRGEPAPGALVRLTLPARPDAGAATERGLRFLRSLHPFVLSAVATPRAQRKAT